MHDIRRPGKLWKPVGRGRVGHRNSRADAVEVRAHVGPVPSGRPTAIEDLRRVGLKEHAVDHAVAAQAHDLIREERLGQLVGHTRRYVGDLRVLARNIEDGQIVASGGQPRWPVNAAHRRRQRTSGVDDENAFASAAGQAQLGRDDRPGRAAADDDGVVAVERRIDVAASTAAEQSG